MNVGSLFTGAGGLDLAVRMLWPDARLAWWSEVDEHAAASFARHTDAPNLGDITQIDWTSVEPVDVIVGGFPCQDLSHAGKRAGLSGDRSGLWFHMLAAMNALRPSVALLENVAGIYTATGDDDDVDVDRNPLDGRAARPARALDVVLGSLADDGWDAVWGDYRASDVGACHQRRRWFCVAYDPLRVGGAQALQRHGGGTQEGDGAGVPDEPDRDVDGVGPDRSLTLLPTPRSSDGPHGGPGQVNGRGIPDSLPAIGALLPTVSQGRNETSGRQDDAEFNTGTTLQDVRYANRWGDYTAAIARWEHIVGRPAPSPTDNKQRLSPSFVEWMMGWPPKWTTGTRSQRLKQCGNGVVPLQAAVAYQQLIERLS